MKNPSKSHGDSRGRLLLVEDDASVREVLTLLFRTEGWRVAQARNGRAGLEVARRTHPHVVVTDLRMPDMSGIDMARRLSGEEDDGSLRPPMVAITSDTSGLRDAALQSGLFSAVLSKPLAPAQLLVAVRQAARPPS